MQLTFITIHDLSDEALILYSSDSIVDILGHYPDEVVNRPTWDFFDPAALQAARSMHRRSVKLDKASVLVYCDIRNKEGNYIRCECCFSVVYNVMVACVSVYNHGMPGLRRRIDAPVMRRLFSSSPKDPRYHMLQHLSARFNQDVTGQMNEPRAALFLNRFTRSLAIMYATSGIESIIGISGEEMRGRSFYHCIDEACLVDAVSCLETAKANDSLAYLRFISRDPRQDDEPFIAADTTTEKTISAGVSDAEMTDVSEGGHRRGPMSLASQSSGSAEISRDASAASSNEPPAFDTMKVELEAIISCTSDGLVVCLRRARTPLPAAIQNTLLPEHSRLQSYTGYFAAPWADPPLYNHLKPTEHDGKSYPGMPSVHDGQHHLTPPLTTSQTPETNDDQAFLRAIQECGVLAWGLVGINGSLADMAHGQPTGDAIPAEGPAVWVPDAVNDLYEPEPPHQAAYHA